MRPGGNTDGYRVRAGWFLPSPASPLVLLPSTPLELKPTFYENELRGPPLGVDHIY